MIGLLLNILSMLLCSVFKTKAQYFLNVETKRCYMLFFDVLQKANKTAPLNKIKDNEIVGRYSFRVFTEKAILIHLKISDYFKLIQA